MKINTLLIMAILMAIVIACSSNDNSGGNNDLGAAETDEARAAADIIELFERMREGDKTVLYEHEFDYYKEEVSLNDYYTYEKIMVYQYDTMKTITVDSVTIVEDTATAYIQVTYEYRSGGEVTQGYPVIMYRSGDRWIKPSMSYYKLQIEYETFKAGEREAEEFDENRGG